MLDLTTILIFLVGLINTHSQDIQSYEICPSRDITIPVPNTNVVITHRPSGDGQSSKQCTLHVEGPNAGGYIALKGASVGVAGRTCGATLNLGNDEYCVLGNSIDPVISIESDGEMDIKVDSAANEFDIELVTNYVPCLSVHQSIILEAGKSGVISSRYPTRSVTDPEPDHCTVVLSEVPQGATLGVYPLVNSITKEGPDRTILMYISEGGSSIVNLYNKNPPLIVPSSGNGVLHFNYLPEDDDEISLLQFIIQITVLTCSQSLPIVNNSAPAAAATPYLAGLTIMEYQCKDEYQFKSSEFTSIICEAKIVGGIIMTAWSNTTNILCIPEPKCFNNPITIQNTDKKRIDDKNYIYQCSEGYTGDTANVTVKCTSPDEDRIPWSWDAGAVNTILNCKPVSCEVPDDFVTVGNGQVEFNKSYSFNEHLLLTCDSEYSPRYEVKCNSSGYWSAEPECIQSDMPVNVIWISVGVSSAIVLVGLTIAAVALIVNLRNRNQENIKRNGGTEELRNFGGGGINSSEYEEVVVEPAYLQPVTSQPVGPPQSRSATDNLYENQLITHQTSTVQMNSEPNEYEMIDRGRETEERHVYTPLSVSSSPGYVDMNQRL